MSLKRKVVDGLKWAALGKIVSQLFSWVSTFLVIRILSPSDYGIIAISTIVFSFAGYFAIQGFITAIVKTQRFNDVLSNQVFTVSMFFYVLYSSAIFLMAGQIGAFYNNTEISHVLQVLALAMPLNCLTVIPIAQLNINLDFKTKAMCDTTSSLAVAVITLILAYSGFSYWALVYSRIAGVAINCILLNLAIRRRYRITLDLRNASSWFFYAIKVQTNALIWFAYNRIDTLIIGKYLGVEQAGIYNVAIEIASIPAVKVSSILNQVGFSAFASLEEDRKQSAFYLKKSINLIAIITFPIFLGISVTANELILLLAGNKWAEATPIIAIFSWVFSFRLIRSTINNYNNAMGRPEINIQNTLLTATILIPAIFTGAQFGIMETAVAWLLGYTATFLIVLVRTKQIYQLQWSNLFSWVPKFAISATMAAIVFMTHLNFLHAIDNVFLVLLLKAFTGTSFIGLVYFFVYKDELINLFKR